MELVIGLVLALAFTVVAGFIWWGSKQQEAEDQKRSLPRTQIERSAMMLEARRQMLLIARKAAEENHQESPPHRTHEGR